MSCGVGYRCGSDPELLWLWCRPAAKAPIRPLAWEPPYATGVALEKAKRQKNKNKNKQTNKQKKTERERIYLNSIAFCFPIENQDALEKP